MPHPSPLRLLAFAVAVAGIALACPPPPAVAQPRSDTLFSWRDYSRTAHCRVRLFATASGRDARAHVFLVDELADNRAATTLDDGAYLVEQIGRAYGIDPAAAYWVFHWGAHSFAGAEPSRKSLLLRATYRRTSGRLGSPSLRLLTRSEFETLVGEPVALEQPYVEPREP